MPIVAQSRPFVIALPTCGALPVIVSALAPEQRLPCLFDMGGEDEPPHDDGGNR